MTASIYSPNLLAGADVRPYRACLLVTATNRITEATANARVLGVSEPVQANANGTSTLIASAGQPVPLSSVVGQVVQLELGGTVTVNAAIVADAQGRGVAAATTGTTTQNVFATALEGGAVGNIIRVMIDRAALPPVA